MPKTKQITYRLHLTDSNNHAVFLDVKLEQLTVGTGKALVDLYKASIKEYEDAQKQSVANDKKVAKRTKDNANKLNVKAKEPTEEDIDGDEGGEDDELSDDEIADLES